MLWFTVSISWQSSIHTIRIFNGCEVWIENFVTRVTKPRDAEQLSRVTEFLICTEQSIWFFFFANSFFNDCIEELKVTFFLFIEVSMENLLTLGTPIIQTSAIRFFIHTPVKWKNVTVHAYN